MSIEDSMSSTESPDAAAAPPQEASPSADDTAAWWFAVDNEDFQQMSEAVTPGRRAALLSSDAQQRSAPEGEAFDLLGYSLMDYASDEARNLTLAVSDVDASAQDIEAVCVVTTERLIAVQPELALLGPRPEPLRPSALWEAVQLRQALTCIAAHPNATPMAVRQAIRVDRKYAAREVLRRSDDPDMLDFALDNADVGVWHALIEGAFNPALRSERLDDLVALANSPVWRHGHEQHLRALRSHPNLTESQRAALPTG